MAIKPVTREERFLAAAGGRNVTPPTPITRKEQLLQGIIDEVKSGASLGGGGMYILRPTADEVKLDNMEIVGDYTEMAAAIDSGQTIGILLPKEAIDYDYNELVIIQRWSVITGLPSVTGTALLGGVADGEWMFSNTPIPEILKG